MTALVHLIAGARPNFMKIAPIVRAFQSRPSDFQFQIIHTGQHYDRQMSDVFFEELGIPHPDQHLDAGGGSHAEQTAKIMTAYEQVVAAERPDCTTVVGDVNSTVACSLVATKMHIPVAHVEAGLRSGDRRMPEEINRLVTDAISDIFFTTERAGLENLLAEGKPISAVHFVGHVMVDNLLYQLSRLNDLHEDSLEGRELKSQLGRYGVVTMHRPSNVDDPRVLSGIIDALTRIADDLPLVFPVHPRTRKNMDAAGITVPSSISLIGPLSYMAFLNMWKDASLVLTDSGGLQEETTALGVPCLTMRENTERPVTVSEGTNQLVGTDPVTIERAAREILAGAVPAGRRPELWDGSAAVRIVDELARFLGGGSAAD
ncbi:MAG: UDP-N-acetylglucosamine 2-epimerase (non-hydrolyzing) [Pseudomonadota bacterium]